MPSELTAAPCASEWLPEARPAAILAGRAIPQTPDAVGPSTLLPFRTRDV